MDDLAFYIFLHLSILLIFIVVLYKTSWHVAGWYKIKFLLIIFFESSMYAHYKHNSTPFDTKEKRRAVSILLCQRSPLLFYNYAAGSMCALWSANFVGKFGIKHGFTAHHAFTLIVLTPFPPLPPPSSPPITFYFASSFFLLLHAYTDTLVLRQYHPESFTVFKKLWSSSPWSNRAMNFIIHRTTRV